MRHLATTDPLRVILSARHPVILSAAKDLLFGVILSAAKDLLFGVILSVAKDLLFGVILSVAKDLLAGHLPAQVLFTAPRR